MIRSPALTVTTGAIVTVAAFVAGHFLYESGKETVGYAIGVMAMAPLALSALIVWRRTEKIWPKALFWVVVVLWAAMLVTSVM